MFYILLKVFSRICLVVIFLQTRYLVLIIRIEQWQLTPICAFLVSKFLLYALMILIIECRLNGLSIVIVALFLDELFGFIIDVRLIGCFIEGFIMIWLELPLTRKNHRPPRLFDLIILLSEVVVLLFGMTLSFLKVLNWTSRVLTFT